ncbi:glycosyltransferase [Candidatus Woesearchaeota archaeon]|nr:glycosyltransferase [Candidatus Woesearchaeota archaeon]MBW3021495.1 glycosyltransferase [Candidatus Woesearchaeota archaeon]
MKTLIIRADGSNQIGMGHIARMSILYKTLSGSYNVIFISVKDDKVKELLLKYNIKPIWVDNDVQGQIRITKETITENDAILLFNDSLEIKREYLEHLKDKIKIINYDDPAAGFGLIDCAITPTAFLWSDRQYEIETYQGFGYFIMSDKIKKYRRANISKDKKKIVISMGGADTYGLSIKLLNIFKDLPEYDTTVILGPGFEHFKEIESITIPDHITIVHNVENLYDYLNKADICFCAGGITLFELMYIGTPTVSIAAEKHETYNCEYFRSKGAVKYLGFRNDIDYCGIPEILKNWNYEERKSMSDTGKSIIDGNGLDRVKKIIEKVIQDESISNICAS